MQPPQVRRAPTRLTMLLVVRSQIRSTLDGQEHRGLSASTLLSDRSVAKSRYQISFIRTSFTSSLVRPRYRMVVVGLEWLNRLARSSKPTPYFVRCMNPKV